MSKSPIQIQQLDQSVSASAGSFVNLSKIAAPYTTVVKRAQCTDFSQDLMPRFGVERVMIQSIQEVQGEFGPNGERVFKPINDQHDAVRMVGSWSNLNSSYGQSAITSTINDYIEISFYGTGLNLCVVDSSSRDIRVSIDGGAEGSNIFPTTGVATSVIANRNYSPNIVLNATSGLSLGLHTVKIRFAAGISNITIAGYEVLNTNSTIQQTPGTSYAGGRRLYAPSLTTSSYNSGFTNTYGTAGTKGGCVLVYQKADGTIAKDIRYTDTGAALTLTSTSHTNEEVVRTHYLREFGAGRADDFSSMATTAAFTLDDGTTTLVSSSANLGAGYQGNVESIILSGNGSFWTFTFVGTGLDIMVNTGASVTSDNTMSFSIDGGTAQTINFAASKASYIQKVVSGLPYGTHTVKFLRSTASSQQIAVSQFIVYAPTAPSLPSGAVALGQYYLMADYTANSTAGTDTIAAGVLRKSNAREMVYVNGTGGSLDWFTSISVTKPTGLNIATDRNSGYFEYTFVGTGFDYRFNVASSISSASPVTVNGIALNASFSGASGISCKVYGTGVNFGGQTGTFLLSAVASNNLDQNDASSYEGAGFSVNGLPFGKHTVRIANNSSGGQTFVVGALDIITPVHTPAFNGPGVIQNVLSVGSCAMMDKRKFSEQQVTPVKAWAQAVGVYNGPNVAVVAPSFIPLHDISTTIKTNGGNIRISYSAVALNTNASAITNTQVYVDGVAVGFMKRQWSPSANQGGTISDEMIVPVAPGFHKIDVYCSVNAGTGVFNSTERVLTVQEL